MMPTLTVWSLRAALTWLVVAFTLGALLLVDKGIGTHMLSAAWLDVHIHTVLVGWLVQAVFAIGYWMLPRFGRERTRAWLAATSIVLLNAAVLMASLAPWFRINGLVVVLETVGVVLYAAHIWPRVKAFSVS